MILDRLKLRICLGGTMVLIRTERCFRTRQSEALYTTKIQIKVSDSVSLSYYLEKSSDWHMMKPDI